MTAYYQSYNNLNNFGLLLGKSTLEIYACACARICAYIDIIMYVYVYIILTYFIVTNIRALSIAYLSLPLFVIL